MLSGWKKTEIPGVWESGKEPAAPGPDIQGFEGYAERMRARYSVVEYFMVCLRQWLTRRKKRA